MPSNCDSQETETRLVLSAAYFNPIGGKRTLALRTAMHRILVATLALLLGVGAAMAEQATGTVGSVDPTP